VPRHPRLSQPPGRPTDIYLAQQDPEQLHLPVQQSQVQPELLHGHVPVQPQAPSFPQGQSPEHAAAWPAVQPQLPSSQLPPCLQTQLASHWQPFGPRHPALVQLQTIVRPKRTES
jgi:hypothetical protein